VKNIIIIGGISLVLFSVSAALSVWLQSTKQTAATHEDEKDYKKKKSEDSDHATDKDHKKESTDLGHSNSKSSDTSHDLKPLVTGPKESDHRAELRRLQMEVVLQDMRLYGDEFLKLSQQVNTEMKSAMTEAVMANDARAAELSKAEQANAKVAADLKKSRVEMDTAEKMNTAKIATVTDQMPADKTAEVIQQLADKGQLDTAVKILSSMKERTAARVIAELKDPSLAPQLFERMRLLKQPQVASADQ
jgi:flagellar motility protein MotE (MotC chaperone)